MATKGHKFQGAIIRHACGHLVEHSLKAFTPSQRAAARDTLRKAPCHTCQVAEQVRALAAFEHERGLPQLIAGSRLEIDEARAIRRRIATSIEREREIRFHTIQRLEHDHALSADEATARRGEIDEAIRGVYRQNKVNWWLKQYDTTASEVIDYVIRRVAAKARHDAQVARKAAADAAYRAAEIKRQAYEEWQEAQRARTAPIPIRKQPPPPVDLAARMARQKQRTDEATAKAWRDFRRRDQA